MKKVYLIYVTIPSKIFDSNVKYLLNGENPLKGYRFNKDIDSWIGLYGWTCKKSECKEFLDIRNSTNIYNYTVKEMDKDEYKKFKNTYFDEELDYYHYKNENNENSAILSTRNESVSVVINGWENFMSLIMPSLMINSLDYLVLKNDAIISLDILGYTREYDLTFGNDERADNTSFNDSFGLGAFGYRNIVFTNGKLNEVELLFKLFRYLFGLEGT